MLHLPKNVFRSCLSKVLLTVGALDYLDHNPSSTTSVASFHGSGIRLFKIPTKINSGKCRPLIPVAPSSDKEQLLQTTTQLFQHNWINHALPHVKEEPLSLEHSMPHHNLSWINHQLPAKGTFLPPFYKTSAKPAMNALNECMSIDNI